MKREMIRTLPVFSALVIGIYDLASLLLTAAAIVSVSKDVGFVSLAFLTIMVINLAAAAVVTRKLFRNGAVFYDDRVEFTAVDTDNVYYYNDIQRVAIHKDTKASPKKRYTDRYTSVILYLKNGEVATVELGATTKRAVEKIENKINEKIKGE